MKVLLIGHACGPGMGSEPGFTWNWAISLSAHHRVWVLTHPQFRSHVEAWLLENPNPNIKFIWVSVESALDPWNPARSERGIRIHYFLWLSEAYAAAQKLCEDIGFDIAHHVSWGTLGAAPPLWRLPVPSVWGPLGGGQCAPLAFLGYFGHRAWQEVLRSCYVRALRFSPSLRKATQSATAILATNRETQKVLKPIAGAKVQLFLDSGLRTDLVPAVPPADRSSGEFTLLWAGRLEHRKALALALHALVNVRQTPAKLVVAGTGPLRPQLEALAIELGLADRVKFLGTVPYETMQSMFQSVDAFLFTSLRDSFGSVVLEAMAQSLPIITLDHQGVGTFVPDDAGIKVPVTNPRNTIAGLTAAIEELGASPSRRRNMQLAAWRFAKGQTWDLRAERMSKLYEEVLSAQARNSRLVLSASKTAPVTRAR